MFSLNKINIEINRFFYEVALSDLVSKKNTLSDNDVLIKVEKIAKFSTMNFNGLLSDYRIEKIINDVAKNIFKNDCQPNRKSDDVLDNSKHILHIVTELYNVGGHTRVVKNWIMQDKINKNSLVIINGDANLDSYFEVFFKKLFLFKKIKKNQSLIEKTRELKSFILDQKFDLIVLHIHPFDVVTVAALSLLENIPIIFYNHADHLFSLGVSVSDAFIDFREKGRELSLNVRGCKKSYVIPYPLEPLETKITRNSAREKLLLGNDDIVMVTMASSHKYKPIDDVNFFLFYSDFLRTYSEIKLYAIGVTDDDYKKFTKNIIKPDNIFLLGNLTNPEIYLAASDYFLEPYPFGTGLGVFDAIRRGAFPIFSYNDYSIYGGSASNIFPDYFCDEQLVFQTNFKEKLYEELKKNKIKKAQFAFFENFIKECEYPNWIEKLFFLYNDIFFVKHSSNNSFPLIDIDNEYSIKFSKIWSQDYLEKISLLYDLNTRLDLKSKIIVVIGFCVSLVFPLKELSIKKIKKYRKNLWLIKKIIFYFSVSGYAISDSC